MRPAVAVVAVAAVGGWVTDVRSTVGVLTLLLAGFAGVVGSATMMRRRVAEPAADRTVHAQLVTVLGSGLWFLLPLTLVRVAGSLTAADLVLVGLVGAVLVRPEPRYRPVSEIVRMPMVVGIAMLVAGAAVGALNSPIPAESARGAINLALGAAIPLLVVLRWNPGHDDRRRLFLAWTLGAALSALVGIIYLRTFRGRALGLAGHPNQLAMISVMALPLAYRTWRLATGPGRRIVAGIAAAILVTGVVISGSRSGLMGLLLVAVLVTFRAVRQPAKALVLCTMVVVVGALWWQSVDVDDDSTTAFARLAAEGGGAASTELREGLLEEELERLTSGALVGSGLRIEDRPHNVVLDVWTSTGVIGLAGFALLAWHGLAGTMRSFTGQGRSGVLEGDLWAASVAFAGYIAIVSFNNALWNRFIWTHVGLLAALRAAWLLDQRDDSSS